MTVNTKGNASGVGGSQDITPTEIDDTDSPYPTKGEDRIHVDTTGGPVTVEIASADIRTDHEPRVVDVGLNASSNAITIESQDSETFNPGSNSSIAITVDGGWADLWSDGSNLFVDRAAELQSLATGERTIEKIGGRGISNSTQSISDSTVTTVELDAVDQEDDSAVLDVDTTNNRIRVKKAGWISMDAGFRFNETLGDGTRVTARLAINGTLIAEYQTALGADERAANTVSDSKDLSVDDDIQLEVYHEAGVAKNLDNTERTSIAAIHEG